MHIHVSKNILIKGIWGLAVLFLFSGCTSKQSKSKDISTKNSYQIVGTGQTQFFDKDGNSIASPKEGDACYGQDAQFQGAKISLTDNGDGTITDNNTGLMWQKTPDDGIFSFEEAQQYCDDLVLAGYDDWRTPTTKDLFSIVDFGRGEPVIDTIYFDFPAKSEKAGHPGPGPQGGSQSKPDDARTAHNGSPGNMPPPPQDEKGHIGKDQGQFWSSELYKVGTTHGGAKTAFGVNHVTGHIKGYPSGEKGGPMGKRVRAVRGAVYSQNKFVDNGDGTISDLATGLMWMKDDYGKSIEWEEALSYCNNLNFAGYDDWKLPDVKELQSIVDYSGVYPAVNPTYFNTPKPDDKSYYNWLWTSTSRDCDAWYVAFGYGVGLDGEDSHGAGSVRNRAKYKGSLCSQEKDSFTCSLRAVRVIK